ncbi:MAG: N-acetyltransferase family protein [Acidimicrobiia bacterium]
MEPVRTIELARGRRLEIREMTAPDADLLDELYHSLSTDDLHKRFFTAVHPARKVLDKWATIAEHGGYSVIVIEHRGEASRPVAEAGYALLADGFGELAVTVAPDWRGWLGPYLVEILVEHAAAAGIPGLQAEVLADNTTMRRLLGHRGAVATEQCAGTMQLVIGTTNRAAPWIATDARPRVLVEVAGGRWGPEAAAHAAGLVTRACPGPGAAGGPRCPLLDGEECPLAAEADAIVMLLPQGDERTAQIIECHRTMHPRVPLLLLRGAGADVPPGCIPLASTEPAAVVAQLLSLIGGAERRQLRDK